MYSTNFDASKVDLHEIETLTKWLQGKTGQQVTVAQMIVVTTDSADISAGLDSFRDAMNVKIGKGANGQKGKRARKQNGKGANEPTMGPRFWRIEGTGEVISRQKLNARIEAGEIAELTNVVNAAGEQYVVMNKELVKGPHQ